MESYFYTIFHDPILLKAFALGMHFFRWLFVLRKTPANHDRGAD